VRGEKNKRSGGIHATPQQTIKKLEEGCTPPELLPNIRFLCGGTEWLTLVNVKKRNIESECGTKVNHRTTTVDWRIDRHPRPQLGNLGPEGPQGVRSSENLGEQPHQLVDLRGAPRTQRLSRSLFEEKKNTCPRLMARTANHTVWARARCTVMGFLALTICIHLSL